jgi:hydrogenase expression/formation protein HypD
MRHVDEYRDAAGAAALAAAIARGVTRHWTLMEVCGGQTHAILRFGLDEMLPDQIELIHGPGCPVCVTGVELIDRAVAIAALPDVVFCSFGDMLRVPGSEQDLASVKACGGDVRVVYSPLDALALARAHPDRKVVFFAVGFETTAPTTAMTLRRAAAEGTGNFSVLVAHVLVPPALEVLLGSQEVRIEALLAPGHVCAVTGTGAYQELAREHHVPIVITGFEPLDLLGGVRAAVDQLESGAARMENAYARAVREEGNRPALEMLEEVFVTVDRTWRGLGPIPASGYGLKPAYARFDAERLFDVGEITSREPEECLAGLVLQGRIKPTDCPEFGRACTPEHPKGAPMVSAEGACAAYFEYGRGGLGEG